MKPTATTLDKSAIGFSLLCAIHCVGTPFLIIMLPALASTPLADETFHKMLLLGVLPLSIFTLIKAYLNHHQKSVLIFGGIGLGLMLFAGTIGHDTLGETGERVLTLIAAGIVTSAHFKNIKSCHIEKCHQEIM